MNWQVRAKIPMPEKEIIGITWFNKRAAELQAEVMKIQKERDEVMEYARLKALFDSQEKNLKKFEKLKKKFEKNEQTETVSNNSPRSDEPQ
jgi:hypothetical protein